mgnify:CR=1 FL=1
MEMLPVVADATFKKLAVIDDYISFIWTSRFYAVGDFELCVPVKYASIMRPNYYIFRTDDENVGIIEKIDIQNKDDGTEMIIASGRFIGAILARRIVAEQTQFNNKYVSAVISGLITDAIINPSVSAREISNFRLGTFGNLGEQISTQYTGTNLMDAVSELCRTYNLGFKITIDSGDFVFSLYEGKDRTYNQSANTFAIFSNTYDNLFSAEYCENHAGIINAVLVAGEGEGTDRKTVWVQPDSTLSGLALRELYLDQRNVQSNDGEISPEEYMAQLAGKGAEAITDYTTAFTGSVDFNGVKYKEDVNLGDICVIENAEWGIRVNARLVEVIESTDETGTYSITPTFGFD